jgi:hypothetical protein
MNWSAACPSNLARQVASGEFSPEARDWLVKAFSSYLAEAKPDDKSITRALGLDRQSLLRCRDDALREAARLLELESDNDLRFPVAARLAAAVAYHKRLRREPKTDIEYCIATAFSCGQVVPGTTRRLYDLIY